MDIEEIKMVEKQERLFDRNVQGVTTVTGEFIPVQLRCEKSTDDEFMELTDSDLKEIEHHKRLQEKLELLYNKS